MGFGEAYHQGIIQDNFMAGYKRIKKPKSEYVGHHRIALTIEEQKKLIQFLIDVDYSKFKHKYLFLLFAVSCADCNYLFLFCIQASTACIRSKEICCR